MKRKSKAYIAVIILMMIITLTVPGGCGGGGGVTPSDAQSSVLRVSFNSPGDNTNYLFPQLPSAISIKATGGSASIQRFQCVFEFNGRQIDISSQFNISGNRIEQRFQNSPLDVFTLSKQVLENGALKTNAVSGVSTYAESIIFDPTSGMLIAGSGSSAFLKSYRSDTLAEVYGIVTHGNNEDFVIDSKGKIYIATDKKPFLRIFESANGAESGTLDLGSVPKRISIDTQSNFLTSVFSGPDRIEQFEIGGTVLAKISIPITFVPEVIFTVEGLAGEYLLSGSDNGVSGIVLKGSNTGAKTIMVTPEIPQDVDYDRVNNIFYWTVYSESGIYSWKYPNGPLRKADSGVAPTKFCIDGATLWLLTGNGRTLRKVNSETFEVSGGYPLATRAMDIACGSDGDVYALEDIWDFRSPAIASVSAVVVDSSGNRAQCKVSFTFSRSLP